MWSVTRKFLTITKTRRLRREPPVCASVRPDQSANSHKSAKFLPFAPRIRRSLRELVSTGETRALITITETLSVAETLSYSKIRRRMHIQLFARILRSNRPLPPSMLTEINTRNYARSCRYLGKTLITSFVTSFRGEKEGIK